MSAEPMNAAQQAACDLYWAAKSLKQERDAITVMTALGVAPNTEHATNIIHVGLDLFSAGCLRPLLTREIAAVERQVRVAGDAMTPQARQETDVYLQQLTDTLAAVELALRG